MNEMTAPAEVPRPRRRSIWESRSFKVVYASLFTAVIILASISLYFGFSPSSISGATNPTFTIDNVSLSFAGPPTSNLTSAMSWCARCWDGTYDVANELQIDVAVALVGAAAPCTRLGETLIDGVETPSTGKFEVEKVSWQGTSISNSGYLPVHLPYGNASACDSIINLFVDLSYIPPGPTNETLSLVVSWTYASPVIP